MGDNAVVSEQFIQGGGLQSGIFTDVERHEVETEDLHRTHQTPQRVAGGVDTTVVV
jgi:hypothetical protein